MELRYCSEALTNAIEVIIAVRPLRRVSVEAGGDFLTEQLQRFHDPLVRNLGAAIHLAQDAVEPELLLQFLQTIGYPPGRADDQLLAQRIFVGDVLQPAAARGAIFHRAHPGTSPR